MGLGRDTRNKILAVSHFQSRIGSDQEYSDLGYSQAQVDVDGDEYAVMDMPQSESGLKFRGLTEKKKRRSSATTAAPRPQPPNHHSSSSSAGQSSYHPAPSQSAYFQSPVQGSPPPMDNRTFIPQNQQYQSCNPNQGYAYANANQPYQNQGQHHHHHQQYQQQQQQQQQQNQHPQYYNQEYNQIYNQYTTQPQYPPASQSQPAQPTQQEYWVCKHGYNIAIHRFYCPHGCVNSNMSGING